MNKKETIIPIAFVAISLLFVIVSAMVYFTKGKSPKWVARKMVIGGLLLTFSCESSSNYRAEEPATCYMIVPKNEIEISIDSNKIVYGSVGRGTGNYSYAIVDKKGVPIQKDNISLRSWFNDPENEDFVVEIKQNLDTGKYQFRLFNCKLKEQDSIKFIRKYEFNIKHE